MTREQAQANAEALFAIGIALNGIAAGTVTLEQAHLHQCVETLNRIGEKLLRDEGAQWQPTCEQIDAGGSEHANCCAILFGMTAKEREMLESGFHAGALWTLRQLGVQTPAPPKDSQ